jgi:hypothetical protein
MSELVYIQIYMKAMDILEIRRQRESWYLKKQAGAQKACLPKYFSEVKSCQGELMWQFDIGSCQATYEFSCNLENRDGLYAAWELPSTNLMWILVGFLVKELWGPV